MSGYQRTTQPLVIVAHKDHADAVSRAGYKHVEIVSLSQGGEQILDSEGSLKIGWDFHRYILALPKNCEWTRDDIAVRLGDDRCTWLDWPLRKSDDEIGRLLADARPMWIDEVATIDDIPEPGPVKSFVSGFSELDKHGFRFTLPAFMPIIGPYGSGKSVLLRQLLIQLWMEHGWKFLITSFEEKIKPRYLRDFRRHIINDREPWSGEQLERADDEIRKCAVFLRRKRNTTLDLARLIDRIEYAVRVHGVRVVAIDPVNEIDHQVPKGETKTDYMGKFIMALKQLADDYGLLMICCAHPPKDGVEKRMAKGKMLTLNDGADTAHWGNKADIGWCVWRNVDGPTYLNCDKLKDHEAMGRPFLAELLLNEDYGNFYVNRMGYDILADQEAA